MLQHIYHELPAQDKWQLLLLQRVLSISEMLLQLPEFQALMLSDHQWHYL